MSARRLVAVATALMCLSFPNNVFAWGSEGHRIVGAIADQILEKQQPDIHAKIKQSLGASLEDAAVWADCAKGFRYCHREPTPEEKAYASKNKDHHQFHYTDVPIEELRYVAGSAGTEPDDVVQVIRYAVNVLLEKPVSPAPANLDQREAIWVLAHLVGDIHQPLHVGAIYLDTGCANVIDPNRSGEPPRFGIGSTAVSTHGGNDLVVGSKSLHSYWDDMR